MILKIILRSIQTILQNFVPAIRLTALPWSLLALMQVSLVGSENPAEARRAIPLLMILSLPIVVWIFVGWHRFILLKEGPALFGPRWKGDAIKLYFWKAFVLTASMLLISVPFLFALFVIGSVFQIAKIAMISSWVCSGAIIAIWLRNSLVLPAAAIGVDMKQHESWAKTKGAWPSFAVLAAAMLASKVGLNFFEVLTVQAVENNVAATVIVAVAKAFFCLLYISILTTLYGHLVEGRELTP